MNRLATAMSDSSSSPGRSSYVATGLLAFAFYLVLGDPTEPFDLVTGLISAAVVAVVLGGVTFERAPSSATLRSFLRAVVFVPRLLWAVVRANLALAAVVLHPRLPIDPAVVRLPAPESAVARALLANSITLTPGTVTLDVDGDELVVHALTASTREELLTGSLARQVAFVTGETERSTADEDEDADETGGVL